MSRIKGPLGKGSRLTIFNDISTFETRLQNYIESVQKFNPNLDNISKLLRTDSRLEDFVKLLINHQNFGTNLNRLQVSNSELDNQLLEILDQLNECRDMLLDLPDDYEYANDYDDEEDMEEENIEETQKPIAEQAALEIVKIGNENNSRNVNNNNNNNISEDAEMTDVLAPTTSKLPILDTTDTTIATTHKLNDEKKKEVFGDNPLKTDELLKYAARLAKFTTIPATSDLNIGPNNYIWPAEDALRKGMLATAVRYRNELIAYKSDDIEEEKREQNILNKVTVSNVSDDAPSKAHDSDIAVGGISPSGIPTDSDVVKHERSGSFDAYQGSPESKPQADDGANSPGVALDLFNSDEESD